MILFDPLRPSTCGAVLAVLLLLSGCGLFQERDAPTEAAAPPPPAPVAQSFPGTAAARSAADLDATTAAERAAALGTGPVAGQELGRVRVSLGAPAEQGFWLKSPLVTDIRRGSVTLPGGPTVAVELRPGEGAAQLSLAAFRALDLPLTGLPEVTVTAN